MADNDFKTLEPDDAVALWRQGKDAWNAWVEEHPEYNISFNGVNFSEYRADFPTISFEEFNFPIGDISFSCANFGNGDVDFSEVRFSDGQLFS